MVSKYIVIGVFLAGLILGLVPKSFIHEYLGNPGMISLTGIAILAAVMYVCAVGHIPFIAAVVASGAAPGVAITFLMTGAATNLPELISIYKIIGRRSTIIYSVTVVAASLAVGYLTNVLLMPAFVPDFNPDRAFVFQDYALFPWMTVRQNVLYPMKQQKVTRQERERRLQELLALAHLEGCEHLYPNQISGGMKQRTAVIRALACNPQVLLMDEPLGAVDHQMRQLLQEELEAIWLKDRRTVLMVTHDLDEAIYLSDRVIVLSAQRGAILEDMAIGLDRPRVRRGPRYHEYRDRLTEVLRIALKGKEEQNEPKRLLVAV